jgi:hypothetical protein
MANYVKSTNFTAKDSLPSGNSGKIIKGAEIDTELTAVASAISSKADTNSPALTGTPTAPTAVALTNTTQVATTAFVTGAITTATGSLGTISTQNANNVAITGGSITGITDLAVADGGTGASSFTANNVLLGNGTSSFQTVAPSTSGFALRSNGTTWVSQKLGLGLSGEVWNNVTGSRLANQTYTNSNSYPIVFAVSALKDGASNTQGSLELIVDGLTITRVQSRVGNNIDHSTVVLSSSVIVPPGKTYSASLNGTTYLQLWNELY